MYGDDSAVNGFKFKCRDLNDQNETEEDGEEVQNGEKWGTWRGWGKPHPKEFLCGGSARSERPQGTSDDSALNGFTM